MKLDKAIEILDDLLVGTETFDDPDQPDSIKLGIEALKAIEDCRKFPFPNDFLTLPGETNE